MRSKQKATIIELRSCGLLLCPSQTLTDNISRLLRERCLIPDIATILGTVPSESAGLSESVPAPSPTEPACPPDPVEQLYRELEVKIREYRPKDDLTALEKAFRFASR